MKRLIDATKIEYENIYVYPTDNSNYKECVGKSAKIREAETVLTIPENPTNGDMIKALFPNIELQKQGAMMCVKHLDNNYGMAGDRYFYLNWWNAPWKENNNENSIL